MAEPELDVMADWTPYRAENMMYGDILRDPVLSASSETPWPDTVDFATRIYDWETPPRAIDMGPGVTRHDHDNGLSLALA